MVHTLIDYLSLMTKVVFRHDGTLDKFLGDAIMAVLGPHLFSGSHPPCHPGRPGYSGRGKGPQRERGQWDWKGWDSGSASIPERWSPEISGPRSEWNTTVIGDNVNIAARLEDLAMEDQILITRAIYEKVAIRWPPVPLDSVQ